MDPFLATYNVQRLNQEEMDNMNRWITSSETQFVLLKNPRKHKLYRGFLSNIWRPNTYPSQTIPKSWRGWNTPKIIPQGHHYGDTETRQKHYQKETYSPVSLMNIDEKILNKVLANWILHYTGSNIYHDQGRGVREGYLFQGCKDCLRSRNQLSWYTTLTKGKVKITWSSQ